MTLGVIVATYVLTGNVVFTGLLGLCPMVSLWSSPRRAFAVGCSLFFVCTVTTATGWAVDRLLLEPLGVGWLGLISAMLLAAGATQLMETVVKAVSPALATLLAPHTEQTMLSSAVLGVVLMVTQTEMSFAQCFVAGLSAAGGVLLAGLLLASVHVKLELEPVPRAFRGIPVALITLTLMTLAFMAFRGLGS